MANNTQRKKVNITVGVATRKPRVRRNRRRSTKVAMPRRMALNDCGRDYINCVIGPTGSAPAKVPDGACQSVLIEYETVFSATPNGGIIVAAAYPGIPCSGIGLEGNFSGLNREGSQVSVTPASSNFVLFNSPDFNSGVAAIVAGTASYQNGNTRIMSARCVSQRMEVIPSGALLQQGGAAATCKATFRAELNQILKQGLTSWNGKTVALKAASPTYTTGQLPTSYTAVATYPDSKICTGTESCVLMSMPPDELFWPAASPTTDAEGNISYDSYVGVSRWSTTGSTTGAWGGTFDSISGINQTFASVPNDDTDIVLLGNFWWQKEGDALMWAGTGLPDSQSYNFRVKTCMELCISHLGSSYRPFVTPPAEVNDEAIDVARTIMRQLPSSIPKPDSSPGWWSVLTDAATGIGDLVSSMGIPVVSGAAAIATKMVRKIMG